MDGIALASVVTSGVVGLAGVGAAVWTTKMNAALTRENRVQERKEDAYLELLRIIEREGSLIKSRTTLLARDRIVSAELPDLAQRATADALMTAYGSSSVRERYSEWRAVVRRVDSDFHAVGKEFPPGTADVLWTNLMARIRKELVPEERRVRTLLAEAVARELSVKTRASATSDGPE